MLSDRPTGRPTTSGRRPSSGGPAQGGWTLLELMVVCSLFSIFGAIAVPQYGVMAMQMRTTTASTQLLADLGWAREMAMRTGVSHYIDVDNSLSGVNYRVRRAANPAAIQPASDPVVRNSLLGARIKGVRFTHNGATADPYGGAVSAATPGRVVFDARGLPSTSGAFFLASDDGKVARAVSVTGAGRVRVWSRIGSTWQ